MWRKRRTRSVLSPYKKLTDTQHGCSTSHGRDGEKLFSSLKWNDTAHNIRWLTRSGNCDEEVHTCYTWCSELALQSSSEGEALLLHWLYTRVYINPAASIHSYLAWHRYHTWSNAGMFVRPIERQEREHTQWTKEHRPTKSSQRKVAKPLKGKSCTARSVCFQHKRNDCTRHRI